MVKVSVNRFVSLRMIAIRKEVKANTQRLRERTFKNLDKIFRVASLVAKGEIKHQRIFGKMVPISLNQRRRWVLVAACVAQIMNSIASGINEREINTQLDELERLAKEASAGARR